MRINRYKSYCFSLCLWMVCLAAFAIFTDTNTCWALSPPWNMVGAELSQTIGLSPCVQVGEVQGNGRRYTINVQGCTDDVAQSLAVILVTAYKFGNVHLQVRVLDPAGQLVLPKIPISGDVISAVENCFETALAQNPLFVVVHTDSVLLSLYVEMRKEVVQFWTDNLGDYNGNSNKVAADAFRDICQSSYSKNSVLVGWSTSVEN